MRRVATLVAKGAAPRKSSPVAEELRAIAAEQAALRPVATLVAGGAVPGDSAVTGKAR